MPIIPRLIHPVECIVKWPDYAGAAVDDVFREAKGSTTWTSHTLPGQVRWGGKSGPAVAARTTAAGAEPTYDGYILFFLPDLEAINMTLKRGCKVVKVGNTDVSEGNPIYLCEFTWQGTYNGRHYLVKAWFERKERRSGEQ